MNEFIKNVRDSSRKTKLILAGVIFFACVLVYGIISDIKTRIDISKEYRYCISYKISFGTPRNRGGGPKKKYTYMVNGKLYWDFTSLTLKEDGTKYFIKYYPQNPDESIATEIVADSNDVKNMPADGYKELPHN